MSGARDINHNLQIMDECALQRCNASICRSWMNVHASMSNTSMLRGTFDACGHKIR